MWPNEQINGISFCGALMNGENRAVFFSHVGEGGSRTCSPAYTCLKRTRWCLRLSALERYQCFLLVQVRFEADITAGASRAAVLCCRFVLASVRLEPNRLRIHVGTEINLPSTAPVVHRMSRTLNYVLLMCAAASFWLI